MNEIKFKDAPPIRLGEDISGHPAMIEAMNIVSEKALFCSTKFSIPAIKGDMEETTVAEYAKLIAEAMENSAGSQESFA